MVAMSTLAELPLKSELHASVVAVVGYDKQTIKQSRTLRTIY